MVAEWIGIRLPGGVAIIGIKVLRKVREVVVKKGDGRSYLLMYTGDIRKKKFIFFKKKLFPCLLAKEKEEREEGKRDRKGWKEGRRNTLCEIAGRWKGGKQKNGRRKL